MVRINFRGAEEKIVTRKEFPLSRALETLKDETIAVIGYGELGPGQSLNLKDNGFNVIVGQRKNSKSWEKAVADGWIPGKTLFEIEEAAEKGTIIQYLLSAAGQISAWPAIKKHLRPGKALYFSYGMGNNGNEQTDIVPPADVDVILSAPKESGISLRRMFLLGRGLSSGFAISQDATGKAGERVIALGIGVGYGYLFETTLKKTAQRSALDWWRKFRDAAKPVFDDPYTEVIPDLALECAANKPDYREKLEAELKTM